MLQNHQPLVLNWFSTGKQHSSGAVEGMHLKAKLALRKAFGFRSYQNYELALYHTLGHLPATRRRPQILRMSRKFQLSSGKK